MSDKSSPPSALTIADVAAHFDVSAATVLAWVRSGELAAVNVSRSARSKKPRWRITAAALEAFAALRVPTPPIPRTRRRNRPADVIQFYT